MKVYQVELNDTVNSYPDNSIIINMQTYTYFLKKSGIEIPDNLTFKDAIENYYKEYSEEFSNVFNEEYDLYSFSNEKETIKLRLNKIIDTVQYYQNYNADKINFEIDADITKKEVDFEAYDKLIFVDSVNGSDDNDGTENKPFKTLYKAEMEAEYDKNNLILVKEGKYNLVNKYSKFNSLSVSGIGLKNKNISYCGITDDMRNVIFYIDVEGIRYDSKFLSFFNNLNGDVFNITFVMNDFKKAVPLMSLNSDVNVENCIFLWKNKNIDLMFNTIEKTLNAENVYFVSDFELNYIDIKTHGQINVKNSFYDGKFKNIFDNLKNAYNYSNDVVLQSFILNTLI